MKNNRGSNQSITDESRRDFVRKVGLSLGGLAACSLVAGNSISTALAYTAKSNSADIAGYVFRQPQLKITKYKETTR